MWVLYSKRPAAVLWDCEGQMRGEEGESVTNFKVSIVGLRQIRFGIKLDVKPVYVNWIVTDLHTINIRDVDKSIV